MNNPIEITDDVLEQYKDLTDDQVRVRLQMAKTEVDVHAFTLEHFSNFLTWPRRDKERVQIKLDAARADVVFWDKLLEKRLAARAPMFIVSDSTAFGKSTNPLTAFMLFLYHQGEISLFDRLLNDSSICITIGEKDYWMVDAKKDIMNAIGGQSE